VDILEKKLERQCQRLEVAEADKENLERECERLKNERMVCLVQTYLIAINSTVWTMITH
jgi:hypothetical protein